MDLHKGDGIEGMLKEAAGSAALVFTDLPAGITKAEYDVLPDIDAFFRAAWHILQPAGTLAVMVADLKVAATMVALPYYRFDMVWVKSRPTGFFNAKKRPLKAHEHILIYYKEQPVFFPQMTQGHRPINSNAGRSGTGDNYGEGDGGVARAGATDRYPTTVLTVPVLGTTDPRRIHAQQKPEGLASWFILSYTKPDDLVVDPFAGSGSTGWAAGAHGRRFIGWEKYCVGHNRL